MRYRSGKRNQRLYFFLGGGRGMMGKGRNKFIKSLPHEQNRVRQPFQIQVPNLLNLH